MEDENAINLKVRDNHVYSTIFTLSQSLHSVHMSQLYTPGILVLFFTILTKRQSTESIPVSNKKDTQMLSNYCNKSTVNHIDSILFCFFSVLIAEYAC